MTVSSPAAVWLLAVALGQPPVPPLPPANPPAAVAARAATTAREALAGAAAVQAALLKEREKAEVARAAALRAAAAQRAVVVQQARNVWTDQQFENWALGDNARNGEGGRQRLNTLLGLQVAEIDRVCQLTPEQKKKLRLMGWGDAKRVLDDLDLAKRRFNELGNDVQQIQEVMPQVQQIQAAMRGGPFQSGSLVARSLAHTLTPDQRARYDTVVRERQAFRHQAQLALALNTFEESVPLREAQRTALLAVLVKETRPMRSAGQYDTYLLMHQLGRVPEDKLRPVLSAGQLKAWAGMIGQYQGVIQNLRRQGLLTDDDDPPGAAKP